MSTGKAMEDTGAMEDMEGMEPMSMQKIALKHRVLQILIKRNQKTTDKKHTHYLFKMKLIYFEY